MLVAFSTLAAACFAVALAVGYREWDPEQWDIAIKAFVAGILSLAGGLVGIYLMIRKALKESVPPEQVADIVRKAVDAAIKGRNDSERSNP